MFRRGEKPVLEPLLIKRAFNGKCRTFHVNPYTYDEESGWIMLLDSETHAIYNEAVINNQIEVRSKVETFHIQSYEEFFYRANRKNRRMV